MDCLVSIIAPVCFPFTFRFTYIKPLVLHRIGLTCSILSSLRFGLAFFSTVGLPVLTIVRSFFFDECPRLKLGQSPCLSFLLRVVMPLFSLLGSQCIALIGECLLVIQLFATVFLWRRLLSATVVFFKKKHSRVFYLDIQPFIENYHKWSTLASIHHHWCLGLNHWVVQPAHCFSM